MAVGALTAAVVGLSAGGLFWTILDAVRASKRAWKIQKVSLQVQDTKGHVIYSGSATNEDDLRAAFKQIDGSRLVSLKATHGAAGQEEEEGAEARP